MSAKGLGNRLAPPRFLIFVSSLLIALFAWHGAGLGNWADSLVVAFDLAALIFAASLIPLARDQSAAAMRRHAAANDANRSLVLVITALVALAVLAAIRAELPAAQHGDLLAVAKLICTLGLSWSFTNLVFMLHYAHMHYGEARGGGRDRGGFDFPGTDEPNYWDFLYFSFTAGMSFAASDVNVTRTAVRRVLTAHSLLSFLFNIGVLAFSINVLAGAAS